MSPSDLKRLQAKVTTLPSECLQSSENYSLNIEDMQLQLSALGQLFLFGVALALFLLGFVLVSAVAAFRYSRITIVTKINTGHKNVSRI